MISRFDGSPDFLTVFGDTVGDGNAGLVRIFIQFQIVELEKDAKLFGARKFLTEAGPDFVRVQYKLASAGLRGGDFLDLVSEDQGAGIELVILKARDAKGSVEDPEVATDSVFDDEVKAIEAGAQRDGFLVDRREGQRRLKERVWKIAGDDVLESLNDGSAGRGNTAV